MPKSALPPHLQDVEASFPDDSQFGTKTLFGRAYYWFKKKTKTWHAFGPRATEWWARWREFPKTLFAVIGPGFVRFETETWERGIVVETFIPVKDIRVIRNANFGNYYLSAIQYYLKWHIAVQWPLHIQAHVYIDKIPKTREETSARRVLFFRMGARRDADKVYWCPSLFIGLNWN